MTITEAKRKLFTRLYRRLNDRQREALFTVNGPLLVLAGAGSGKTTVLVNRIAHIVNYGDAYRSDYVPDSADADYMQYLYEHGDDGQIAEYLRRFAVDPADPGSVLCVTFTNKAANEFKARLRASLGERADAIWAGTFHSICVRILRRHIHLLGYDNGFTIYDSDDSRRLIAACMKKIGLGEDVLTPATAQGEISRIKEKGLLPGEYAEEATGFRERHISDIYTEYEDALKKSSALDFDDIILLTNLLFEREPQVLSRYRDTFAYILVDEYQDTNPSQSLLVCRLAGDRRNICVVGDDDQSIYSFRGATIENILSFDRTFPDTRTVRLEQNYRSTQNILSAANAVISNNRGRKTKELWTDAGDGDKITVKKVPTQLEEARYIVDYINDSVRTGKAGYGDFAVLYRVNAQSNSIETALARAHVPYRVYGGIRFFERREVKDILAYLSLISNPRDDGRFRRIINVPARGIGRTTTETIDSYAAEHGISLFETAERAGSVPELARSAPKLTAFTSLIGELREFSEGHSVSETVSQVISRTGYREYLFSEPDGEDRASNADELVSSARLFEESTAEPTLTAFLEDAAMVSDTDDYDEDAPRVTLMTVHSAKGLEFTSVFLPGFEEGLFPSSRSMSEAKDLEEERRLAYVAITRAKKRLIILHTGTRMMYGKTGANRISRFAEEIPEELVQTAERPRTTASHPEHHRRGAYAAHSTFEEPQKVSVALDPGTRVRHPFFGEGTVIESESVGGDAFYEIEFDNGLVKKLLGAYAKLTVI